MRRFLTAFAAIALAATAAPARAAAVPVACEIDAREDVQKVVGGVPVATIPGVKTDMARFCAGVADRVAFRWRVPGVDPTTDEAWGTRAQYVAAIVMSANETTIDYALYVHGPFADGQFSVSMVKREGSSYVVWPCEGLASSYDAENKVIRAGAPASCFDSPSSLKAFGRSVRDNDPATPADYLLDEGELVTITTPAA